MDLNTQGRNVFLLELASQMSLDEGSLGKCQDERIAASVNEEFKPFQYHHHQQAPA